MSVKVVKNKNTGVIFAHTEELAKLDHMISGDLDVVTKKFTRSDVPDEGSPAAVAPEPEVAEPEPEVAEPEPEVAEPEPDEDIID